MTSANHGLSRFDQLMDTCLNNEGPNSTEFLPQNFGYLLERNPITGNLSHAHIIDALEALTDSMLTTEQDPGPAEAGMTFLGQFVDHDITLDATSALGTAITPSSIRNVRTPALDLDCVYGSGPEASAHLYSQKHEEEGFLLFGREGSKRDLARNSHGRALIGDPRNDENIIVSQIQGAFIELHNILMSYVGVKDATSHEIKNFAMQNISMNEWHNTVKPELDGFEAVRRFIRNHYQYVVWNEMLPAFVQQSWLDRCMSEDVFGAAAPVMPVEFSGAAYRFGHATALTRYALQDDKDPVGLFAHAGFQPRDPEHDIDMSLFFQMNEGQSQKALPVSTKVSGPLHSLPFVKHGMHLIEPNHSLTQEQSAKLPLRNMLRDRYTYKLSSGQQVARKLGLAEIPAPSQLADAHIDKTPLWFYCLQDTKDGKLDGVGAAIVASVFARLLRLDKTSVVHIGGWQPWEGFQSQPSVFASILDFVKRNRGNITKPEDLYTA